MRPTSETERRQKAKDGSRIDLEPHRLRDSDTGRQITTVRNEGNVRVWPSHGDLMGWHVASPATQIFWDAPLKCNGAGSPARTLTFGSPGALALSDSTGTTRSDCGYQSKTGPGTETEVRQKAISTWQVVGQDKHMAHLLLMIDMEHICLFNTARHIP